MRALAPFAQFGPYDDGVHPLFRKATNFFSVLFRVVNQSLFRRFAVDLTTRLGHGQDQRAGARNDEISIGAADSGMGALLPDLFNGAGGRKLTLGNLFGRCHAADRYALDL